MAPSPPSRPLPWEEAKDGPPVPCVQPRGRVGNTKAEGRRSPGSQPSWLMSVTAGTATTHLEGPLCRHPLTWCLDVWAGIWPQGAELLVCKDWTRRATPICSGRPLRPALQHWVLEAARHRGPAILPALSISSWVPTMGAVAPPTPAGMGSLSEEPCRFRDRRGCPGKPPTSPDSSTA